MLVNSVGKLNVSKRELNPIILKAQVLLDRYHFSRREISGRSGENFKKALVAFGRAEGIRADGKLDAELNGHAQFSLS